MPLRVNPTSVDKGHYLRRSIGMNDTLRKRVIDGINVISNPLILLAVLAMLLIGGWWTMNELTPLLWIIAGAYVLLSIIGGQCAKALEAKPRD